MPLRLFVIAAALLGTAAQASSLTVYKYTDAAGVVTRGLLDAQVEDGRVLAGQVLRRVPGKWYLRATGFPNLAAGAVGVPAAAAGHDERHRDRGEDAEDEAATDHRAKE